MSMKLNLFLILLIVALIAFVATSSYAAPLDIEKQNDMKNNKDNRNNNNDMRNNNKNNRNNDDTGDNNGDNNSNNDNMNNDNRNNDDKNNDDKNNDDMNNDDKNNDNRNNDDKNNDDRNNDDRNNDDKNNDNRNNDDRNNDDRNNDDRNNDDRNNDDKNNDDNNDNRNNDDKNNDNRNNDGRNNDDKNNDNNDNNNDNNNNNDDNNNDDNNNNDGKDNNKNNNNICKNSKLDKGDGTQNPDGYCVETVMGEIPSVDNMISTLIIKPADGSTIEAKKKFRIDTITDNLISGFFSDPVKEYYVKPQQLKNGKILGHSHIIVQKLDDNRRKPLNPKVFAFFKGLDQPAKNGILGVDINDGLPAGDYRICTIVSSFTHQPVIMPIAQRGAQDDCIRIKVRN